MKCTIYSLSEIVFVFFLCLCFLCFLCFFTDCFVESDLTDATLSVLLPLARQSGFFSLQLTEPFVSFTESSDSFPFSKLLVPVIILSFLEFSSIPVVSSYCLLEFNFVFDLDLFSLFLDFLDLLCDLLLDLESFECFLVFLLFTLSPDELRDLLCRTLLDLLLDLS